MRDRMTPRDRRTLEQLRDEIRQAGVLPERWELALTDVLRNTPAQAPSMEGARTVAKNWEHAPINVLVAQLRAAIAEVDRLTEEARNV